MTAQKGWYYYEGDPVGTVRLWDGYQWIGSPTTPPPEYVHPGGDIATASAAYRPPARRLPNQVALAPFALGAALGLLLTMTFVGLAFVEVRREAAKTGDLARASGDDSLLVAPFSAPTMQLLFVAAFAGGALFLAWVWRANANLGMKVTAKRNSRRSFTFKYFVFGAFYLFLEAAFRTILGPVITRMFNAIERSTPGGSDGMGLTIVGFAWWVLWAISWNLVLVSCLALTGTRSTLSTDLRPWANALSIGLAGQVVALILAMVLVASITVQQDQRLANG